MSSTHTGTHAVDLISALTPRIASRVLQLLPPADVFAAAQVSRSWTQLIETDTAIWVSLLKSTGTWFGEGSEEHFLRKAEAYRQRSPSSRVGSPPLPLPHPYKLLLRYRRAVLTRWTRRAPKQVKRLMFPAHGNAVVTCLLLSKGRIISASDDHSIQIHDPVTGAQTIKLEGHSGGVWAMAVSPSRARSTQAQDVLVSGSTDRTARVWDLNTGRNTHVFGGHTSTVRCIAIVRPTLVEKDDGSGGYELFPKRTLIVSGSRDHTLRVWRLPGQGDGEYHSSKAAVDGDTVAIEEDANPFHVHVLSGHEGAVRSIAAHGRTVISGSYDKTVRVWDLVAGDCKFIMRGHTEKVYAVALDPIRPQAYSGSMDGTVRIWSLKTGECLHILTGHTSLVGLLSPSSMNLISAAADSTLRIWNPSTGALIHTLSGHLSAVTCLAHDEFKVISGSDGALKMWNARNGSEMPDLLKGVSGVWGVTFDERSCVAAINEDEHTALTVWDFGDDWEADVEAARAIEDADESEDEAITSGASWTCV